MSPPNNRLSPWWFILGVPLAMIPIGFGLVVLAGYLTSFGWSEGPAIIVVGLIGVVGAYMPYAGALIFVLGLVLWLRAFLLQRRPT